MRNRTAAHVLAVSFSAIPLTAPRVACAAEDAPPPPSPIASDDSHRRAAFGRRGVLAIASDANASIVDAFMPGEVHDTSLTVQPSVDYFVADHFSVGVALSLAYESDRDSASDPSRTFIYGAGPRLGYDIALSEHFSLWPKASILIEHETFDYSDSSRAFSSSVGSSSVASELFVLVPYHPAPHFFVGFGPYAKLVEAWGAFDAGAGPSFGERGSRWGGWVGI